MLLKENENSNVSHSLKHNFACSKSPRFSYRHRKLKLSEIAVLSKQLSSMLLAGLQISQALEAIIEETNNKNLKFILEKIRENIFKGSSFSDAAKQFPKAFPRFFIGMIEAGEASGQLPETIRNAAKYFETSLKLSKKVKNALTYPATITLMATLLTTGLIVWVVPIFQDIFKSFGSTLPLPTKILINLSDFLQNYILHLIIGLIVAWFVFSKLFKSTKGRIFFDKIINNLPLIGKLSQKSNIAKFCRTYSILIKSGVPILQSIEICKNITNNSYIKDSCTKMKKEVQEGNQLSSILSNIKYFHGTVRQMVSAGEKSGNVDKMVENVADVYDNDVENMITSLTSIIEPLIVCGLGLAIGSIVIAIFLPIFNLSSLGGGGII